MSAQLHAGSARQKRAPHSSPTTLYTYSSQAQIMNGFRDSARDQGGLHDAFACAQLLSRAALSARKYTVFQDQPLSCNLIRFLGLAPGICRV